MCHHRDAVQRGGWHGQGQKGLSPLPGDAPTVPAPPLSTGMSPQPIAVSRLSVLPAGRQPGPPTFTLRLSSSASAPLSSSDMSGASSPVPSSVSSSRPIFFPFSRILCFSSCRVVHGEVDTLGCPSPPWDLLSPGTPHCWGQLRQLPAAPRRGWGRRTLYCCPSGSAGHGETTLRTALGLL